VAVSKKKKKGAEGKPQAPDLAPELEPWRRVFAGEVPVLLDCDNAINLRHALRVFGEAKVELVLLNGDELLRLDPAERKGVKGVVVRETVEAVRDGVRVLPAAEFAAAGIPIAFQSNGVNAARGLALNVSYAVHEGLDPRAALRGLTVDAARMFHVDDQVG